MSSTIACHDRHAVNIFSDNGFNFTICCGHEKHENAHNLHKELMLQMF